MKCPRCQQENPSRARVCTACGARLAVRAKRQGAKAKARLPVSRKAPKNEEPRVRDLEKRLAEALEREADALKGQAEALEQQTATSEILNVISRSPTDVQPVFDAIAQSALRLCEGDFCNVIRYDGELLHLGAHADTTPAGVDALKQVFPLRPSRATISGRVVLDAAVTHIPDCQADSEFLRSLAAAQRVRSAVAVPMLRQGQVIGCIAAGRSEVRLFSDKQTALLETFADQAVIAIENVRLFTELQEKNQALTQAHAQATEALEQQTATSEILRVISSSPRDMQPVFETIADSVMRLCDAWSVAVYPFDGELVHITATRGGLPDSGSYLKGQYPMRPTPDAPSITVRAILERTVVHVPDSELDDRPDFRETARARGFRAAVGVPMLRGGEPIGAIGVSRAEPGAFSPAQIELLKIFADQAVIAIENVRLFTELQASNHDLTTALDQQTATSEILRTIASSPTDTQPVFETIVRSAVILSGANFGSVVRFDGDLMHLAAGYNYTPEVARALHEAFPMRPSPLMMSGRAILSGDVVQVEDAFEDPDYSQEVARAGGFRSMLAAPMLRDGRPIGAIVVNRGQPGRFSPTQIGLLKTFADQAVIAIENVRLFTELQVSNRELTTALDKQTATSDILRVISRSQTDVQPVFEAILSSAVRLLGAYAGALTRAMDNQIELAAFTRTDDAGAAALRAAFPQSLQSELPHAQAIRDRAPLNIADAQTDPRLPEAEHVRAGVRGFRSRVLVPLLRHDEAIGAISVSRREPGGFNADEISLLQTFADQAVIAIENVRLFGELKSSNRELRIALEQQTATSELLKVIGRSTFDLQPVFETLAASAVRLCEGNQAFIFRFDGQVLRVVAVHNVSPELRVFFERNPVAPGRGSVAGRAALERRTIHIHDVRTDPERTWQAHRVDPIRTVLTIPMLRGDEVLGVIGVNRLEVRPFSDNQIALLETFADQAAIAIENARLLTELQARTHELTRSVGELRALGEVSQAVSSTLDLGKVLETIVSRAVQLSGSEQGIVYEFDDGGEVFHARATHRITPKHLETVRAAPIRLGEGAIGRAGVIRKPVQVVDTQEEGQLVAPQVRELLLLEGMRSLLAVPLVREQRLLGGLVILRREPGAFATDVVGVLQTFATQSVLAIQNARLFRELADKSRELEAASRHKSEFLANMSHELRTPLNAIIGFSEVLSERMFGELNDKQDEYLKDIHASGQHLLSLINDILDLSKIEAGRMELELSDFDLPMTIESALMLVRERAARRGIELHRTVDERLGHIQADERKIRQVLLNLLSNAIKFTPEGGRIDVAAKAVDGSVEVSVTDTGVGIAPEDQQAVFEEFRQVGTAEKKVEGTGLGLALSRKFIELHGGKIWVKSQVGEGSTFTFTVPARRGE